MSIASSTVATSTSSMSGGGSASFSLSLGAASVAPVASPDVEELPKVSEEDEAAKASRLAELEEARKAAIAGAKALQVEAEERQRQAGADLQRRRAQEAQARAHARLKPASHPFIASLDAVGSRSPPFPALFLLYRSSSPLFIPPIIPLRPSL